MDKKKLIRYGLYALVLIIIAVIVGLSAIWIKYKVMDFEVSRKEPKTEEYSIYYNSLSYKHQLLYDAITQASQSLWDETEILPYSYTMEEFRHVLKCLRADKAELFYVAFDELVLYHSNHKTKVGMIYLDKPEVIEGLIADFDAAVDKAMEAVLPSMNDFEKEVAINDYLTDNCVYALGTSSPYAATAYGALVEGSAFCDGYAYAAKLLLNRAYINSTVVFGTAADAEHVWNMVEIDGHFYHLDVMWNDADLDTEYQLRFHGYFNLSDDEISADHSFDNEMGILPCATVEHNYYEAIGCYAATLDELEEIFYGQLLKAVEEKRVYIELLCPESKNNEDIGGYFNKALRRVNDELGADVLHDAFSVYDASAQNNSVTIQIFYN